MSTHVVGFKPPDERWKQMKAARDACAAAGVPLPDAVDRFFGFEPPDDAGVTIPEKQLIEDGVVTEYNDRYRDGYEIHLDKVPKDVKIIRVYNLY